MFLFLFLGRHSQSIIAVLPETDSASLSFHPITIDRHGQWIGIGSQVKYIHHPCFIFVSVMSSSQSVHSIYCHLPSDIHQLWHLDFQISVVLVKKPISWYFPSKFHILKYNVHKIKVIYLESFSKRFFFFFLGSWWTSVLRQCYILTAIIEQFILTRFEKFYLNILPFFLLSKIFSKFKHQQELLYFLIKHF